MHYFSPKRPTIAGRPYYVSPLGKPIGPLPNLTIRPIEPEPGSQTPWERPYELGCHLLVAYLTAAWHSCDRPAREIPELLQQFTTDVEQFLAQHFSYSYEPSSHVRPARPGPLDTPVRPVTLADLGL